MEKIVCRFKSKLSKMIKDSCRKFDDYSISPKTKQILLHPGCDLKKKFCCNFFIEIFGFFYCIKDESLSTQQKINIAKSKEKLF